ncbi:HAMP domain-containing sensor histidine kinase [Kiritimatiellota bacterium B12222]|nr:HAMP domain-containing sensor histidine kinase [Kiritimatiellota bacterium B12222]
MKLWLKLFLALLVVSVLPAWLLSRYASSSFHHFTRKVQEEQMAQTGRWMGELFRELSISSEREAVLAAHAEDSGRRLRYFSAEGELIYDSGEGEPVFFDDNPDVTQAMVTGTYAARWWLTDDHARLYYFSAVPVVDDLGELQGVAQVVEHTGRITNALIQLHLYQKTGLIWMMGGAVVVAILFSFLLTRRLRRLRQAARDFALEGSKEGFVMRGRDEVAELASGFYEMADQLEIKQRYNREFVQTTLHELKTPLTAMHGAADILKTRPGLSEKDRRRFSENIQIQSDRLLHLVKELDLLTSLEEALPAEIPEKHCVGPLVKEIVDRIRPGLQHRIEVYGEKVEVEIEVVPARLEQVMINLIQNADRYHCGDKPLRVEVDTGRDGVRLWVDDDGPGISEEDPMRIFDRYFTTVSRDETLEYGRGLGLAIVKRIVLHYGGEVFAESREWGGARVGVVL